MALQFTATTDFKHDYAQFEVGESYEDLPDELVKYFVEVGWGTSDDYVATGAGDAQIPPGQFRIDKDLNITERPGDDALHTRGPSPDLEIQDSITGSEIDLS